jgi:exodeoxyribonuclease VII large subunit
MIQMPGAAEPLRLSALTALVADAINKAFRQQSFWVIADVTNHTFRAGRNHHYFELVEKDPNSSNIIAKLQVVAWSSGSAAIAKFQADTSQPFTNNINVLVNVTVQYHPVYGLQLSLNQIDSNFTLGVLERQRQATLERLVRENQAFIRRVGDTYITKNKELPLGCVIQKIAVVCSSTSAGWQDFQHTLENNPYGFHFIVEPYFTVVQGEANVQAFVDRLVDVFRGGILYDAVVIIRGGGSQTDFLIFDDYLVGKAVAKFPIPIITGIGHQRNETIADLMACIATKTPTKAAEFIINHNHNFDVEVSGLQKQIIIRSQQLFSSAKDSLVRLNQITVNKTKTILFEKSRQLISMSSALSAKPTLFVSGKIKDIQQLTSNIKTFIPQFLKNQQGYLGHNISLINALSPENTLKRGFAIIKSDNRITSDPEQLIIGKDIEIILAKTSITSTVKSKKDYHGNDFNI